MPAVLNYPHIEKPDGKPARLARQPRVRVAQIVMARIAHGWSDEELVRQYPHLTPSDVHAALLYYDDHQQEIEVEIEAEWREAEKLRDTPHTSPFYLRAKSQGLL